MTEDLKRANAVLMGGRWTSICSAEDAGEDGWIKLTLYGGVGVTVRATAIAAVKYVDRQPEVVPDFAFDLGRS